MIATRNLLVVLALLLAGFVLYLLLPSEPGGDPAETGTTRTVASNDYADLLSLFGEFRSFQQGDSGNIQSYSQSGWILSNLDAAPDFSATAMAEQYGELGTFQARLQSIDPTDWSISQQVDYQLVRAELNGYEFQHRVLSPWSRDPGFYNDVIATFAWVAEPPLQGSEVAVLQSRLQSVPDLVQQAKANLTDFSLIAADLATLAILSIGDTRSDYEALAEGLRVHHPELVADVDSALIAIDDYEDWIRSNEDRMTGTIGVGRENYNWLLRNVYLLPYTWDDIRTIVELEDNRVITFQRLEENRNRDVPPIVPVGSQVEYREGIEEAVDHIMSFLRNEEIFTVHDFLVPDDYFDSRLYGKGYSLEDPWPEKHDYFFNFSHREAVMENTHELVGHHFDMLRAERDSHPIRGGERPYKISTARDEGLAFALEELLMHAGYLDGRNPHGREITYEQAAFRTVRALSDIYMHSGDWSLEEAMRFCVANAPHGELLDGSHHLWFELDTTLRGVGHHMLMVLGKVQFMKVMRDRANQLGDDFNLREFLDEVYAAGQIPWSLMRWEMTGYDDEVSRLW
ncbi:MAG: DUF885 domain-containing protein [Holophagales bacterium]|nr:DUF885 domain-containing protein [Holophagales bacterium]MYH25646.1 DUF885 domain-containing protein [Holophagales bacterium]